MRRYPSRAARLLAVFAGIALGALGSHWVRANDVAVIESPTDREAHDPPGDPTPEGVELGTAQATLKTSIAEDNLRERPDTASQVAAAHPRHEPSGRASATVAYDWEVQALPTSRVRLSNLPPAERRLVQRTRDAATDHTRLELELDFDAGPLPWDDTPFQVLGVLGPIRTVVLGRQQMAPASVRQTIDWIEALCLRRGLPQPDRSSLEHVLTEYEHEEARLRNEIWQLTLSSEADVLSDAIAFGVADGYLHVLRREDLHLADGESFAPFSEILDEFAGLAEQELK